MVMTKNKFNPDYAIAPGKILEEHLEVRNLSSAEFARRCGRSAKLISEILSGKAPVEPETALQFEKVLGLDAKIWLGIEFDYRLHKARKVEVQKVAKAIKWAKSFPVKELVKLNYLSRPESDMDLVSKILKFFGVASIDAWDKRYNSRLVAYRHSPAFESNDFALATWLRFGDIEAEVQNCAEYDKKRFKQEIREIRKLTREPIAKVLTNVKKRCNESGVVLALVPPLPKTAVSGAARWHSPNRAIIQLSGRHKTSDHLWFDFFHESAHILLHNKRRVFIDGDDANNTELEEEANKWAADALISYSAWKEFTAHGQYDKQTVQAFADDQEIAAGIVVGRLQHEKFIPWKNSLNNVKENIDLRELIK